MSRLLVVDDESEIREVLSRALRNWGYEVAEAENGSVALEKAFRELPDVILLDVSMPVVGGFEVLENLRKFPGTMSIPVILFTTLPAEKGELTGIRLGVEHYLTKPCDLHILKSTLRVALGEAKGMINPEPNVVVSASDLPPIAETEGVQDAQPLVRSGIKPLDEGLKGGICTGSLTLIEGTPAAGNSALSRQLACEALAGAHRVAFLTSEDLGQSPSAIISFFGRDVSVHMDRGRLCVLTVEEPSSDHGPGDLLSLVSRIGEKVPPQYDTVIIDSISALVVNSEDQAVIEFFRSCKAMCKKGKTILVVLDSSAVDEMRLVSLRSVIDTHMRVSLRAIGRKSLRMVELLKANKSEVTNGKRIAFEVHEGVGLLPIPIHELTL